jgi:arginine/ornithine transport system ATP-binding protein
VLNEELKLVANKSGRLKAVDPKQLQRMRSRLMVFQHFNLWSHMSALETSWKRQCTMLGMDKKSCAEKPSITWLKVGVAHRKDVLPAHMVAASSSRWPSPNA